MKGFVGQNAAAQGAVNAAFDMLQYFCNHIE